MYTEILRSIVGIEIFPVISLLLFVGVFTGVLVWAVRADGAVLDRQAALPLDRAGHLAHGHAAGPEAGRRS